MNTKEHLHLLLVMSVFALMAATGTVQAMEMTTGDSMMKKDDAVMMKNDSMMPSMSTTTMGHTTMMMQPSTLMSGSQDLMLGSRGEAVITLQSFLETHSFLVFPAGVMKGYFGPLTKAALQKYQMSVDVPATGYYGPITRGVMSNMMIKTETMMKKDDSVMMMKTDGEMMSKDASTTMKSDETMMTH